jgi:anti-sigma factor RsiW
MTDGLTHNELQMLLGAYVLGGLDAADRRRLEEHLPGCAACTAQLSRFAGVPGLLRLSPACVEPAAAPEESLPRLIAAARARRAAHQRRRWMLAAAAVVTVLAGVTGGVLLADRDTGPAPTAVVSTFGEGRVAGEAVLEPRAWGTQVRLNLNYPPYGKQPYTAWAVANDGHQEQAGAWTVPPNGQCSVTAATSIQRDRLDHIEVRTADGKAVLRTR